MSTSGGVPNSEPLASGEVGAFFNSGNGEAWMIGWTGGHRCPRESPELCALSRGGHTLPPTLVSFGGEPTLEVRGGHSLFSLVSSLAESPVIWEATLEVRGPGDEEPCFFVCCSNRPMIFATLGPGFSLGNGLKCRFDLLERTDEMEWMAHWKSNSNSHCCGKPNGQSERSPARFCGPDSGTKGPWLGRSSSSSVEGYFAFLGCVAWLARVVSAKSSGYRARSSNLLLSTWRTSEPQASLFPPLPASSTSLGPRTLP